MNKKIFTIGILITLMFTLTAGVFVANARRSGLSSRSISRTCATRWKSVFQGMTSDFVLGPNTVTLMGIGGEDFVEDFRRIQDQVQSGCDMRFVYNADDVLDSEICQVITAIKGNAQGSYSSIICEGKRTIYELKLAHNSNIENPFTIERSTTSEYESEAFGANAYLPGDRTQMFNILIKR